MDDVVIVGGGIIGAATAYFLSKEGRKVKVIERDPTYKKASFPLSLGGFRRQFFQKENILLGKFAREFINQIPELLRTEKNVKRFGEENQKNQIYMTQLYLYQAVDTIQSKAKQVIISSSEGDEQRGLLMGLKRFTKYYEFPNIIDLKNKIADQLKSENKYCF